MLLIPDMIINMGQKAFYPSPADVLMHFYKENRQI